jgi:hypothetical protein
MVETAARFLKIFPFFSSPRFASLITPSPLEQRGRRGIVFLK